jgi:hypothetical protein
MLLLQRGGWPASVDNNSVSKPGSLKIRCLAALYARHGVSLKKQHARLPPDRTASCAASSMAAPQLIVRKVTCVASTIAQTANVANAVVTHHRGARPGGRGPYVGVDRV